MRVTSGNASFLHRGEKFAEREGKDSGSYPNMSSRGGEKKKGEEKKRGKSFAPTPCRRFCAAQNVVSGGKKKGRGKGLIVAPSDQESELGDGKKRKKEKRKKGSKKASSSLSSSEFGLRLTERRKNGE